MIKRFMIEFALDSEQVTHLRNHCNTVEDYTQNIKAMMSGALRSGDYDNDVEYVSEELLSMRDEEV